MVKVFLIFVYLKIIDIQQSLVYISDISNISTGSITDLVSAPPTAVLFNLVVFS